MPSASQDYIYNVLKKYRKVKFKTRDLAKVLKMNISTLQTILAKMIKNKGLYPGFTREYKKQTSSTGREFICHVYFVK